MGEKQIKRFITVNIVKTKLDIDITFNILKTELDIDSAL